MMVLHSCWHKKESCHKSLKLLVKMLEYYSYKMLAMILFRIQRHPSKPETERDGLKFLLLSTFWEKMYYFFSLPVMKSWNLDKKEPDTFLLLEVLVDMLCIFHPIFDCGILIDTCF